MGTDLMIMESAAAVLSMADSVVSIETSVERRAKKLEKEKFREELRLLQSACRERGIQILSDERFRIMERAYEMLDKYTPGTFQYNDCVENVRHLSSLLRKNLDRYYGTF